MKTACRHCRDMLMDLKSREPGDASGTGRMAHLAGCPSCAEFLADQDAARKATSPLADARRAAVPPEDLSDRIVARIQQEAVASSTGRPLPFFLRASTRRYAPIAAGFAVFLAFGILASLVAGGVIPSLAPNGGWFPDNGKSTDAPGFISRDVSKAVETDTSTKPVSEGISADSRLVATTLQALQTNDVKGATGAASTYDQLVASGALGAPASFRGYRNTDGSLTLLLLYPSDTIQDRADGISEALAPCASPFRIEIIDGKDIGGTFTALGLTDVDAFLSGATGTGYRLLMVDLGR
jgi:hypothetical protein